MKIKLTFHNSLLKYTTGIKTHTVVCDDFEIEVYGYWPKADETNNFGADLDFECPENETFRNDLDEPSFQVKV